MKWTQVIFLALVFVVATAGFNLGNNIDFGPNFEKKQAAPADDWVFYGGHKFVDLRGTATSFGIVLNRRTGQRFNVLDHQSFRTLGVLIDPPKKVKTPQVKKMSGNTKLTMGTLDLEYHITIKLAG